MCSLIVLQTEFLGYSQTFVGTLAAIIVLCILSGDSNFIIKAIENFAIKYQAKINDITSKVDWEAFRNKEECKRLHQIIIGKGNSYTAEISNHALSLWEKINGQIQDLIFRTVKPNFQKVIKNNSPELTNAPLYTVLYAIILFAVDETLYVFDDFQEVVISIFFVFTVLTCLYWIVKWIFYVKRLYGYIHIRGKKIETAAGSRIKQFVVFLSDQKWYWSFLIHFFAIVLPTSLIVLLCHFFPNTNVVARICLFWAFAIFIPVVIFGLSRECVTFERERKITVLLSHFLLFLIYSAVIIALFELSVYLTGNMHDMYLMYDDTCMLKFFAIIFIVLNGLVIPYVLPHVCFVVICQHYSKRANEIGSQGNEMLQSTFNQINVFFESTKQNTKKHNLGSSQNSYMTQKPKKKKSLKDILRRHK